MTTGQGLEARPQLLTYPDSLGGDLRTLAGLLEGPLSGLFRGVHILPPFPSSGDRGFAPVTYDRIDPRFGSWADVERIAADYDVLLDVMINHISRASPEFSAFQRLGRDSPSADLFLTLDKVWPGGEPRDEDVAQLFLRKPGGPFSTVTIEETGKPERIWTTFGSADWAEQVDLDVNAPATRALITELARLAGVTRRPDRPARCRGIRDQEARHDVLHGRAGDLRVPGLGRRRRRDDGPRRAARSP